MKIENMALNHNEFDENEYNPKALYLIFKTKVE